VVSIKATPADGWRFEGWTGDVADPDSPNTSVTVDSDKTVTARFSPEAAVSWPLVTGIAGGVVLAGLAVTVVVLRRRAS
jgi:uncharacterized repeat protein (TIGR02543 family)